MNGSVLAASPGMSEARSVWTYEAAIAECSPNKRIAEAVSNVGVKNHWSKVLSPRERAVALLIAGGLSNNA
jgi:ATP/maltotriose-dependent transcriptional regulator MalT